MTQQQWQVLHLVISVLIGVAGMLLFLSVAAYTRLAARAVKSVVAVSGFNAQVHDPVPPMGLLYGADGRLSTSKSQWFLWTLVIVGGYCAVVAARGMNGDFTADVGFPGWLLTAMGFTTATMATAKGITTVYTASYGLVKTPTTVAGGSAPLPPTNGLLTDDAGDLDLSKVQLLTWTIVAIGIWLFLVGAALGSITFSSSQAGLPDIGPTLLVLTGLTQGGYLGKKLATLDSFKVSVSSLVPSKVTAGSKTPQLVRIFGTGFGDNSDGMGAVKLDGSVVDVPLWSDTRVEFQVPANQPAGSPEVILVVSGVDQAPKPLDVA